MGRQGSFPHGIDIVTRADYFSVGSRPKSYLEIGRFLGGYPEYRRGLLEHLSTVKYTHWDEAIRLLSARAAAALAPLDAEWATGEMLPRLFARTLSTDLKERHGAAHMAAETLLGLASELHGGDGKMFEPELRKQVASLLTPNS